jgi:hypothetical protein
VQWRQNAIGAGSSSGYCTATESDNIGSNPETNVMGVDMTRRELLCAFGISVVAWPAAKIGARGQAKPKTAAKTATVTLAISGMT